MPGKRTSKFNPPQKEFLDVLSQEGTYIGVAKHYHTTLATVLGYRKRNKIQTEAYFGRKCKIDLDELERDCKTFDNPTQIAKKHGVAISVIRRLASENPDRIILPQTSFEQWKNSYNDILSNIDVYKEMNIKQKMSMVEIAEQEDISLEQLKKAFAEIGFRVIVYPFHSQSKGELEVRDFIRSLGFECNSIRPVFDGKRTEIDCYVEEKSFGVEYCGEYYHSSNFREPSYHFDKFLNCKQNGISLMTIFEHEWKHKRPIVESMIKHRLGISGHRVFARNTIAKQIDSITAKRFHQQNHIHGHVQNSSSHWGLFLDEKLLMVVSLGHSRFDKSFSHEITRFSTLLNTVVVGGFSKLMKKAEFDSIVTYCDLRFGEGKVYERAGFKQESASNKVKPNYWYFSQNRGELSNRLESRIKYQKHRLKKLFPDSYSDVKTEKQIMEENGFFRIYDCGNIKFSFQK